MLWARSAGELAANLSNLLNVGLLGLIPAARGHFTVDLRLHVQTFAQRTVKCLVDIRRIGFDGTVQIEVADAFGRQKKVFHDFLVVALSSLYQTHQVVEQLLVRVMQLACAGF